MALLPRCSVATEVCCWLRGFGDAALTVAVLADGEAWGEEEEEEEGAGAGDGDGDGMRGGGEEEIPWRAFSFACDPLTVPLLAQLVPPPRAPSLHAFRGLWPRLGFSLAVHGVLVAERGSACDDGGAPTAAALLAGLRKRCFCGGADGGTRLAWAPALGGGAADSGRGQRWCAWVPLRTGGGAARPPQKQEQGSSQAGAHAGAHCLHAAYVAEIAAREEGGGAAAGTLAVTFTATKGTNAIGRWETSVEVRRNAAAKCAMLLLLLLLLLLLVTLMDHSAALASCLTQTAACCLVDADELKRGAALPASKTVHRSFCVAAASVGWYLRGEQRDDIPWCDTCRSAASYGTSDVRQRVCDW